MLSLCIVYFLIHFGLTSEFAKLDIDLTETSIWTWSTPNPYKPTNQSVYIHCKKGTIAVTVLNLDLENYDYLLIKPGQFLNDSTKEEIFAAYLEKPHHLLYNTNQIFGLFHSMGENPYKHKGFTVIFQRIEEETTVIPTTVPTEYPTTKRYEMQEITVNLTINDREKLGCLRNAIVNMAQKFCVLQNIPLGKNITQSNIYFTRLDRCPLTWPDSDNCLAITFSLPIPIRQKKATYELSSEHLQMMWNDLAKDYLPAGLAIYGEPDFRYMLISWVIITIGVFVAFVLVLCLAKLISSKYALLTRQRMSDTGSIITMKKDSNGSLEPHYLQDTPKFFQVSYPMYNRVEDDILS